MRRSRDSHSFTGVFDLVCRLLLAGVKTVRKPIRVAAQTRQLLRLQSVASVASVCGLIAFSGCHFVFREAPEEHQRASVQSTEAAVMVTAQSAPLHQLKELNELKFELEQALTSVGGLRVRSPSSGSPAVPIDGSMIQLEGQQNSLSVPNFQSPCSTVNVTILDFRPYRPMHLAAEITVINPWTGQQTHINGVWHAQADTAQLADANARLRRELKHMPTRAVLEQESLVQMSPRAFLRAVATQVAPAIRVACLPPEVILMNN